MSSSDFAERGVRVACDSLVALGGATTDGSVLFAKNSDRPALECQPLVLIPAAGHAPGSRVRCQYIETPQVDSTLRILGSRPFWLWGLEHGVNEAGVAIGNHTVFTRDKPEGRKLIGMDLVRLGLERGATARAAVDVICALVERHGQGGSGYRDSDFPYHSSFMVADRAEAFLVETSDRYWACEQVADVRSATNHVTIGRQWDSLSAETVAHAVAEGWWSGSQRDFDFAAAYRDSSWVPPSFSSGRYRRTCEILEAARGRIEEGTLRRALRDHYDGAVFRGSYEPDDERYLSVCMHADPIGATTAAAVVRIPTSAKPIRYWASLGPPCVGVFLPVYVVADLPSQLTSGSEQSDAKSLWWGFRRLLDLVEKDRERRAPLVRSRWDSIEAEMVDEAEHLEGEVGSGADRHRAGHLGAFTEKCVARVVRGLAEIAAEVELE